MKTQGQIIDKLGELVDKMAKLSDALPEDASKVTEDQKVELTVTFSAVCLIGWVLDMDDEVKELLARVKLAGLVNLKGVMR